VVTAVAGKSDSYPEAPWRAFAPGASAAALAGVIWQLAAGGWATGAYQTGDVLVTFGIGAESTRILRFGFSKAGNWGAGTRTTAY